MFTLGRKIRLSRERDGLIRDGLAIKLMAVTGGTVSTTAIANWEKDQAKPSFENAKALEQILGIPLAELQKHEPVTPLLQFPPGPGNRATLAVPQQDFKISELVAKTVEILESNTVFRATLASIINAFHQARHAPGTEAGVVTTEEYSLKLVDLEGRIAELEEENTKLKIRLNKHRKAAGRDPDHFKKSDKSEAI